MALASRRRRRRGGWASPDQPKAGHFPLLAFPIATLAGCRPARVPDVCSSEEACMDPTTDHARLLRQHDFVLLATTRLDDNRRSNRSR